MVAHRETCSIRHAGRVFLPVLIAAVVMVAANTAAGYVVGTNPILEGVDGRAYIPMSPKTSGELGYSTDGRVIGLQGEIVAVRKGDVTEGSLNYFLEFDLSTYLAPNGEPIAYDPAEVPTDTMDLFLDLTDIDFKPQMQFGLDYTETLELRVFTLDKALELTGGEVPFTLNKDNYFNYGDFGDDEGAETNNTQVRYTVNLENDLGLAADDFTRMFTDMGFQLEVTIGSRMERIAAGVGRYRNGPEYLGDYRSDEGGLGDVPSNGLEFVIPEPMTLSLLGLGALGLLRRRR